VFQRFGAKSGNGLKCNKKGPRSNSRASILVAGALFGADSYRIPTLTARWLYTGPGEGTRDMRRVEVGVY
jgi:hypothetical protein